MAFNVPPLWNPKANFNPAPIPAVAHQYWAKADADYASGAFIAVTNALNQLSGATNNLNQLSGSSFMTYGSSALPGGFDVTDVDGTGSTEFTQAGIRFFNKNSPTSRGFALDLITPDHPDGVFSIDSLNSSTLSITVTDDSGTVIDHVGGNSTVKISSSVILLSAPTISASGPIFLNGNQVKGVGTGIADDDAVNYGQFAPVSSTLGNLGDLVTIWPETVGTTWPHTGTVAVSGGLHPASGSMSANLDKLWGDFYSYVVTDTPATMYASSSITALVSGSGAAYLPEAIYIKSQNFTWRITIGDDGALSSSLA